MNGRKTGPVAEVQASRELRPPSVGKPVVFWRGELATLRSSASLRSTSREPVSERSHARGSKDRAAGGFSLVEVNLAILLVGVGLVALFALFPRALQECDSAMGDTQEALFGDLVINALQGNAAVITEWKDWKGTNDFVNALSVGPPMAGVELKPVGGGFTASDGEFEFPPGSGKYLTYELNLSPRPDPSGVRVRGTVWKAVLLVVSGKNRSLGAARNYYTELMYMGE
jgi:hypothetical protein